MQLEHAGFCDIHIHREPCTRFGITWPQSRGHCPSALGGPNRCWVIHWTLCAAGKIAELFTENRLEKSEIYFKSIVKICQVA